MTARSYYELLGIESTASLEDVKRAFRQQIARYHPDKVHHLGPEFQEIAATRAAELTEAYRVLSHAELRTAYDRARTTSGMSATASAAPAEPSPASPPRPTAPVAGTPAAEESRPRQHLFSRERASRDEFVRRAALDRLREALSAVASGTYEETDVHAFDLACVPKSRLFSRAKAPRLLARFVSAIDAGAVEDAWNRAAKWAGFDDVEVCVLLMGSSLAPAGDLAGAIADLRKKTRKIRLTLIPIDARNWDAHMPTDAPPMARNLIGWLRQRGGGRAG